MIPTGILTFLVIVAVIFLLYSPEFLASDSLGSDPTPASCSRKGLSHTPVKILLPSTLLLYGSTALFIAALAGHIASVDRLITQAQAGLFSDAYTDADLDAFESDVLKHSWMMTASLAINVR